MFRKPILIGLLAGVLAAAAAFLAIASLFGGAPVSSPQRGVSQARPRTSLQIVQPKPLGEPTAWGTSYAQARNSGNYTCTFKNGVFHISIAGVVDYAPEKYLLFVTPLYPNYQWMSYYPQQEKDGPSIIFSDKLDTGISLFFQFIIYRMPD